MALLRIKAYQHAKAAVAKATSGQGGSFDQQLAMIWQFPLPWPIELPEDAGLISRGENEKVLKKSLISNLTFFHEIRDSGQQLDLNSLGSPIEGIAKRTQESLLRSFEQILLNDEELADEHSIDSIREVLNSVADWIDRDDESRNGGDEAGYYSFEEQRGYPRNSSFLTMSEVMLVHNMDDLIFKHLQNLTTIHGTFGINVNTAEKDVLMSIDPQFTEETTAEFINRRAQIQADGANLDQGSFDAILSELGFVDIEEIHSSGVPIVYSPLTSFLVTSTGTTGNVSTTIKASVIDASALKEIYIEQLDSAVETPGDDGSGSGANPNDESNPGAAPDSTSSSEAQPPIEGRPLIIHMESN
jgi:hypothetical protein